MSGGSPALRVLYVIPGSEAGPSMIFSKREARAVQDAGVETRIFYLSTRTRPLQLLRHWLRLRRELRAFRPDLVHAHYGTVTAFLAALSTRAPLVITFHGADLGPEPDISRLRQFIGHALSQLAALRARQIICVGQHLQGLLWWRRDRVSVVPSSVNTEQFRPMRREDARAALGWDRDEPVVLFYAGLNPVTKRIDLALAAVDEARRRFGHIRMEILYFVQPADRIPLFLNAADCLLCTSAFEGSPTIVKEAMACNLPIVAVAVADVPLRLASVQNSYIRDASAGDLADGVVTVLSSGRRSDGREHVVDVTDAACRERLLAAYGTALSPAKRPSTV